MCKVHAVAGDIKQLRPGDEPISFWRTEEMDFIQFPGEFG